MEELKISLTTRRKLLVQMYYRYLLASSSLEYIKQDILDETQAQLDEKTALIANDINEKLEELIIIVEEHLSIDWKWERLPALIGAIFVIGSYEIKYTDTPKPVTINEMVKLTKELEPDFDYKFINAVLDKIRKI
ncbi:transcription antitermination factor NusB [Mesoplasma syrphidae]|uniref:Transcription antitermination factor NusB n=1 Tax=Mesoplasma syrphidae TaxID=225999 RepID=A0A2K9C983_9MOLU|nr:transcription antitermination factor NusB [Mesoplasma syrphidae]AUF83585.1 transcription antitermination factor NusB [Mesoplasma syrphidae]